MSHPLPCPVLSWPTSSRGFFKNVSAQVILLSPNHWSPFVLLRVKPQSPFCGWCSPLSSGFQTLPWLLLPTTNPTPTMSQLSPLTLANPGCPALFLKSFECISLHHNCVLQCPLPRCCVPVSYFSMPVLQNHINRDLHLQDAAHSAPLLLLFISLEALSPIMVIPVCL